MQVEKSSSKKRADNEQITTLKYKKKKTDDASMVDMEATLIKDTSQLFLVGLTPLQKLHKVLKDSHVSPDNPHQSEIVHYADEEEKCYDISYEAFLRHHDNGYTGCKVINGFMSLLEEKFNNEGKNKFFPH
jgi:hypothetical protein